MVGEQENPRRSRRRAAMQAVAATLASTLAVLAAPGCGDSGPALLPVQGKVTLDGQPVAEGGVIFHDAGNGMIQLVGAIAADGTYTILHNREPGAPPGKYRVTVVVSETPKDAAGEPIGLPKTLSNAKFSDPVATPLEVEVKPDAPPGAYDLPVTR